ncbi:hypothetical protein VO64_1345 [Pseudomonas synxantha]|uniref:Uncharacterized protein n=1 Tax=Pseudomonas synxantha TaxID=47883 RepID=A0AAU8TJN9_9PSED|nr:hypothetical protein VO64_1345 [Pseudomonas synxantha]
MRTSFEFHAGFLSFMSATAKFKDDSYTTMRSVGQDTRYARVGG